MVGAHKGLQARHHPYRILRRAHCDLPTAQQTLQDTDFYQGWGEWCWRTQPGCSMALYLGCRVSSAANECLARVAPCLLLLLVLDEYLRYFSVVLVLLLTPVIWGISLSYILQSSIALRSLIDILFCRYLSSLLSPAPLDRFRFLVHSLMGRSWPTRCCLGWCVPQLLMPPGPNAAALHSTRTCEDWVLCSALNLYLTPLFPRPSSHTHLIHIHFGFISHFNPNIFSYYLSLPYYTFR